MKKPAMVIGAGAVALLVVAVALVLRPGSDPVAAQQPSPLPAVAAGPAVARLGNQQVSPEELQALLADGGAVEDGARRLGDRLAGHPQGTRLVLIDFQPHDTGARVRAELFGRTIEFELAQSGFL